MRRITFTVSFTVFLALSSGSAVHAAAFRYGSAVSIGEGTVRARYHTLEESRSFRCVLQTLSCDPQGASGAALPVLLAGKRAVISPREDLVLTRELVAEAGLYVNTLYVLVNGMPGPPILLPVTGDIRRVYFPRLGTRIVFATGSELILYDRLTNTTLSSVPFDIGDRVAFSAISMTGKYFAYYQYGTVTESTRVHTLIDLETGRKYQGPKGERGWDLLGDENRLFQFSPDEKLLVYLDDRDGFPTLYRVDLTKLTSGKLGGTRMITKKYTVADFLLWDENTVFFVANREQPLEWNLYRYAPKTGRLEKIANQVSYGGVLERSGNYLLYSRLDAQGSTVMFYDLGLRETAPIPVPIGSADLELPPGKVVASGKSSVIISYPDNFSKQKTYPVIVWLHGGPYRQTATGYHSYQSYGMYDWILENVRRSGYVIAKLDYRGSYGYGRKFADGLRGGVGLRDMADVMSDLALVKRNVKTGPAYLMGNSYGGYLALRGIVEHSKSFAGAISVNGVTDWAELVRNVPDGLFAAHFAGPPDASDASAAKYYQASILGRLDGLAADDRIMLVHSEKDTSVPYRQSVLLRDALAARGRQDVFVSYPGEEHVFTQSATVEDLCRRILEFVGASSAGKCEL